MAVSTRSVGQSADRWYSLADDAPQTRPPAAVIGRAVVAYLHDVVNGDVVTAMPDWCCSV